MEVHHLRVHRNAYDLFKRYMQMIDQLADEETLEGRLLLTERIVRLLAIPIANAAMVSRLLESVARAEQLSDRRRIAQDAKFLIDRQLADSALSEEGHEDPGRLKY